MSSDEFNRKGINDKLHFDVDCAVDDLNDTCFGKAVEQFGVEEACEVAVKAFVTTDEFIAKAKARHEFSLFKPEYGAQRTREENPFDGAVK